MNIKEYGQQMDELVSHLTKTPPDICQCRKSLSERKRPCEVLSRVAHYVVDRFCFCEYRDAKGNEDNSPIWAKIDKESNVIDEKLVSYYLPDILALLLDFGMNPNEIVSDGLNEENLMEMLKDVDYKDCAGRCMRMLLEHGGDPNLIIDDNSLMSTIDFDVVLDVGYGYDLPQVVQCWLVLIGYGGRLEDGRLPVKMSDGYKPEIFKYFEKFNWHVSRMEPSPEIPEGWMLHIYEIETGIEVATL